MKNKNTENEGEENRNISIIKDADGNKIVMINDIRFKGKRRVDWEDVKDYLKQFVGEVYRIADTADIVYIGGDLPDEYSGSIYTKKLKGTLAKAKANAAQGLDKLVEIGTNKMFEDNRKGKHSRNAKYGWYRYDTRFGLPIYNDEGELERYNIFKGRLLVRHSANGKMYLYDIVEIKKETSKSCQA